jgi:hypothetical protein
MKQCKICTEESQETECSGKNWVVFYNDISSRYDPEISIKCICKKQALKLQARSPKYVAKNMSDN